MRAVLTRDVVTPWGIFATGLDVQVEGPDGPDAALVKFGPSMRASVPVAGLHVIGGRS